MCTKSNNVNTYKQRKERKKMQLE